MILDGSESHCFYLNYCSL